MGILSDGLGWLLTDPTQSGGGILARAFGIDNANPGAATSTPITAPTSPGYSGLLNGNYGGGLLGNSPLIQMLRGGAAGLAGSIGTTGAAALGTGFVSAEQQAQQRRKWQLENQLGAQQYASGNLGLKGAALEYLEKIKTAQFYGIPVDDQGNPTGQPGQGGQPNAAPNAGVSPQLGGVNPMGTPPASGSAMVPGPGGAPIGNVPGQSPQSGTPSSNWREYLYNRGMAMQSIPGLAADGANLIKTAQTAPEGYQFSPDFQSLVRIGGGPKDLNSIAQDSSAAAVGALPAKVQEIAAGKSIDLANAGAIGFATTQGTQRAVDQSLKAHNDVVNTLSSDYKPLYENWQKVNEALSTAKQALSNPDQHASDVLLTQAAIQMAVPNATMRVGSIEDINAVVGLPQVLANIRQKITGRGGMTAADRQTLQNFIQNKYQDFQAVHQQDQQSFIKRASAASPQAINPQEFMPDYQSNQPMVTKSYNALPADAIPAPPGPGGVKRWYSATLHGYFTEQ